MVTYVNGVVDVIEVAGGGLWVCVRTEELSRGILGADTGFMLYWFILWRIWSGIKGRQRFHQASTRYTVHSQSLQYFLVRISMVVYMVSCWWDSVAQKTAVALTWEEVGGPGTVN